MKGHNLYLRGAFYHCQCNAWHWRNGPDIEEAYAKHLKHEARCEARLLEEINNSNSRLLNLPPWASKVLQITTTIAVFALFMFTVMHFVG